MRGIVSGGVACVVGAAVGCLTPQPQAPPSPPAAADVAPAAAPRLPPAAAVAHADPLPPVPFAPSRGADGAFAQALGALRNVHLAVDHDDVVVAASGGCTDDPGPLYAGTRDPGTFLL